MFERFQSVLDESDELLKKRIYAEVLLLAKRFPAEFTDVGLTESDLESDSGDFIRTVLSLGIENTLASGFVETGEHHRALGELFRGLLERRMRLELADCLYLLVAANHPSFLLAVRYFVATQLIRDLLNEELQYDFKPTLLALTNPSSVSVESLIAATLSAQVEITRVVLEEESRRKFNELLEAHGQSVDDHLVKAIPSLVEEIITRLMTESLAAGILPDGLLNSTGSSKNRKQLFTINEEIAKHASELAKKRLRLQGPGGSRFKPNAWTSVDKVAFYEKISALEPIWTEARKDIVKMDFDHRQIDVYRTRTELKSVPIAIWNAAIKTWKGDAEGTRHARDKSTTQKYVYEHALFLLDLQKRSFATMKKYAGQGKRLNISKKDT